MQELEKILEEAKMKEKIEKIKVSNAEIVVHGTKERPYYEIKYYDLLDNECHVGFSSYSLDIVFDWLSKCFEIVDKHMNDGWIPVEERLPKESLNSVIVWDAYRERCCFAQYYMGRWILGNGDEPVNISAWRPLPEPYRPERRTK